MDSSSPSRGKTCPLTGVWPPRPARFGKSTALDYWECVGDDLDVKGMTGFPRMAKAKPDETVVFAWIVYRSRKQRDQINAKIMADPRIQKMCDPKNPPFDFKRIAYGGFKALIHA